MTKISPAASGRIPGERLQQFGLAVARDARDADDLAFVQGKGDILDPGDAAIVADRQPARLQHDLAGMGDALVDLEDDFASDHRIGEFGRRGVRGLERRHHFAAPHHGDAIGQPHDLAQFMRDEDDRLVLRFENAQHREKLIGLGRREHGGRLVKHQDFRAADKRLQDFDALLQADRQFADDRSRVDIERVFLGQVRKFCADGRGAAREQGAAFGAEHHVFKHAERRHQHEMLVHHANAVADRLFRRADAHGFAVDANFSCVRFVEAVEDRH